MKRQPLTFDTDRGSNRSRWVAGGLALAIIGWMGSGYIFPSEDTQSAKAPVAPRAVSVAVRQSVAEPVEQVFVAEGQALPDRDTAIRAETSGQISEVLAKMGDDLAAGQVIARFDIAAREADLTRAEQESDRAQREFDNATALVERGDFHRGPRGRSAGKLGRRLGQRQRRRRSDWRHRNPRALCRAAGIARHQRRRDSCPWAPMSGASSTTRP